jgi:hypothetical protein
VGGEEEEEEQRKKKKVPLKKLTVKIKRVATPGSKPKRRSPRKESSSESGLTDPEVKKRADAAFGVTTSEDSEPIPSTSRATGSRTPKPKSRRQSRMAVQVGLFYHLLTNLPLTFILLMSLLPNLIRIVI